MPGFFLTPVLAQALSIPGDVRSSLSSSSSSTVSSKKSTELETVDRFIVTMKKGNVTAKELLKEHQLQATHLFPLSLGGFAGTFSPAELKELRLDPRVASIEPDVIVTTMQLDWPPKRFPFPFPPPSSSSRSSSSVSSSSSSKSSSSVSSSVSSSSSSVSMGSQSIPMGVRRVQGNLNTKAGINGSDERVNADIAIIDTGIDLNHADLNVYKNVNLIDSSKTGADDNGHGTHVAGIAAALDNQVGVVGVAPGARLWAVKVLGSNGSGYMSDIIEGIEYVTQNASEIEVANMSLGCECQSQALSAAISNAVAKGVVFTVAAGNSGRDASTFAPANHSSVITVSAIADYDGKAGGLAASGCRQDKDDTLAGFSNYGSVVDIAAPGACITSTGMGNKYVQMNGTSMASPHVAGAAALYVSSKTKPKNASEADAVRSAITSAGFTGNSLFGFTGDKDATREPLLNVKSL